MSKQTEAVAGLLRVLGIKDESLEEEVIEPEVVEEPVVTDPVETKAVEEETPVVEEPEETPVVTEELDLISTTVALVSAGVDPERITVIIKDLQAGNMMSLVEEVLAKQAKAPQPGERKARIEPTGKPKIEELEIV